MQVSTDQPYIARIHTSDRIGFKRCRRKWNWQSPLRNYLELIVQPGPLWMGSGMHFALEDFHGHNVYKSPVAAFNAFAKAWKTSAKGRMPDDTMELTELCTGMMEYYEKWLKNRNPLKTFVVDGVPQCEVTFEIPLPVQGDYYDTDGRKYDGVRYIGTLDRVAIDDHNRLWLIDYKSAAQFATTHFDMDPQVSAYCWAGSVLYPDHEIAGFVYQQHLKALPKSPETLKNGTLSLNKQQRTTHQLYRQAMLNMYGDPESFPAAHKQFLGELAASEDEDQDRFIRRDWIERSPNQIEAEGEKILLEIQDMLNPELPLYPNATRDCSWDCGFQSPCLMIETGDDFEDEIKMISQRRPPPNETWRKHLPKAA